MFKMNIFKQIQKPKIKHFLNRYTTKQFISFNLTNTFKSYLNMSYVSTNSAFLLNKSSNNLIIKYQKAGIRSMKSKRKVRAPNPHYKMKTHNALKKRIRIVIIKVI